MSTYQQFLAELDRNTLPLHEQHRTEIDTIYKQDADRTLEEKIDHYMEHTYPKFQQKWEEASQLFVGQVATHMRNLRIRAYGSPESSHIIGLATVPNEKLEEVLSVAKSAGDKKLEESVIAVAQQRGERGLVNRWIEADPNRKAARDELEQLPEIERLEGICKGRKPPKATPEALATAPEAIERKRRAEAVQTQERRKFYNERGYSSGVGVTAWPISR